MINRLPMPETDTIAEPIPEPAIVDTITVHGDMNPFDHVERLTWQDLKRKLGG